MKTANLSLVMTAGAALALAGMIRAFEDAGLQPDIRLVYGWSIVAVLGLFLVAWGLVLLTMAEKPSPARADRAQTESLGANTDPSAHSRTSRRR